MAPRDSFRDVDDRTDELRDLAIKHPDIWAEFTKQYELSWIYHENALEGIVLGHSEITSSLRGRPKNPETYYAVRNQRLAINEVRRLADTLVPIDHSMIHHFYDILSHAKPNASTNFPQSMFRTEIPLHRAYFHEISIPETIERRFNNWLSWASSNDPDDDDAVRFAAHLHHEFMSIFPFTYNTGKIGRLLVNYILLRHGYMPVLFHATDRQRYYDSLRHPKREMENVLIDMMINCIENGLCYIHRVIEMRSKRGHKSISNISPDKNQIPISA